MTDEKIKNSSELEFAVFCIENVAAKLGVDAERVYQAFTEQSDILNGYIVPEYEVLHTQSREYIVDDQMCIRDSDKMLEEKRAEVLETVRQCMEATHTAANGDSKASHLIEKSDRYFSQCKEKIAELKSLALLDAMFLPMCQYKDDTVGNIESEIGRAHV